MEMKKVKKKEANYYYKGTASNIIVSVFKTKAIT